MDPSVQQAEPSLFPSSFIGMYRRQAEVGKARQPEEWWLVQARGIQGGQRRCDIVGRKGKRREGGRVAGM